MVTLLAPEPSLKKSSLPSILFMIETARLPVIAPATKATVPKFLGDVCCGYPKQGKDFLLP